MNFSASQIASLISGRIEGDPEAAVSSFGKIEEAVSGQLSFLANPKYEEYLYTTGASVVIINESQLLAQPVSATLIRVNDAYSAFATLLETYQRLTAESLKGIEAASFIHETARIGADVYVGAFAYISRHAVLGDRCKVYPGAYVGDRAVIGADTVLHPGVRVYNDCQVGNRVVIHANTVIGSDGFGFAPQPDGTLKKIPQIGNVIIEDEVEIGANTTIDRATMGSTRIRRGAKLDNLLQIAHNVDVGENTVIAAQTGISGSTKIGRNVMIGGQAGLVGHITIADGSRINAQSGVSKSIRKPGTAVTGSPAYDYTAALRSQAVARTLPELEQRVRELEELIRTLKP